MRVSDTNAILLTPLDLELLRQSLLQCKAHHPAGSALLLLAEAEKEQLPAIQQLAREVGYPILGAIFPALLDGTRFHTRGVVLLSLRHCPSHALVEWGDTVQQPEQAVRTLIDSLSLPALDEGKATLFMIFDGMVPNIATLLDALYLQLADRVNYAGVNAGSETFQPMPCLFDAERVIGHGVLALVLPCHKGAILAHGYHGSANGLTATATEGNKVSHIEWRPAIEVYQELAQRDYGVQVTRDNFYEHAVHMPFGIQRLDGEVLVRIPVALTEDGSLFCVGEIPENSLLTLVQAPASSATQTVEQISRLLALRPSPSLLLFYCAGRRMHMGSGAEHELSLLQQLLGDRALVGALSLGEIGQSGNSGYPLFQNATLVACPWGRA